LSEKLSQVTLVSDGKGIYACRSDREVIDLLGRGQGVFAIALAPVVDELDASLADLSERRRAEASEATEALHAPRRTSAHLTPTATGGRGESPR
jgi:hypothetical protein